MAHRSDACWFYAYTLDTEDDQLIVDVCQGMTVTLLVHQLDDFDVLVQYPALKAVANMSSTETEHIIDEAFNQKVLERLLRMAMMPQWSNNSVPLQEICYTLANFACGSER